MSLENLNAEIVACRKCPRLVEWREAVARAKRRAYRDWDYWGRPVPGFGDPAAQVLVVGLAPGAHGSNRTGRQFTGDASGDFLFPALYRAGFASQPESTSRDDGLTLTGLYVTASGRCAPPGNKPSAAELDNCQPFLERELDILRPKVIVALGRIAFDRVLCIYQTPGLRNKFAHGAVFKLDAGRWLLASYHPSRQNTQTGRLTVEMFDEIWQKARELSQREPQHET
ncbi:MAG: uracil-DNA glycosylase [Chloroflexota bacterium]